MSLPSVLLRCRGCSTTVDPLDPLAGGATAGFRCPNASRAPRLDHVMQWEPTSVGVNQWPNDPSINPFLRYRTLHHSYWLARARGITDENYIERVLRLDKAVAGIAGTGFVITPFGRLDTASDDLGIEVWGKDETGNVAGSHKARHLMGLALHLDIEKVSITTRLAIASCGNAALAAAVVAKATRRPLDVFVPATASPAVLQRLQELNARITETHRTPDSPPGDPCVHAFHDALARGALPFCCQGNENGLTIDGGTTLGQELADQIVVNGVTPTRIMMHVGGGAMGTALMRGLGQAALLGHLQELPPIHCVQPDACAPLRRAWASVANRALAALDDDLRADVSSDLVSGPAALQGDALVAERLMRPDAQETVAAALQFAVSNRSGHMWPWEDVGDTVAGAIVDDETYDWFALVGSMLCTGGYPITVNDEELLHGNQLSASAACESGTADVAGLLAMKAAGLFAADETAITVLSGVRR